MKKYKFGGLLNNGYIAIAIKFVIMFYKYNQFTLNKPLAVAG